MVSQVYPLQTMFEMGVFYYVKIVIFKNGEWRMNTQRRGRLEANWS